MIYVAIRVASTAVAAAVALLLIGQVAANGLSDALLAAVAGFIGCRFLLGYGKEAQAARTSDVDDKATLKADALSCYTLNAFQSPLLLYTGLFACALKILAVLATVQPACARVPGCW